MTDWSRTVLGPDDWVSAPGSSCTGSPGGPDSAASLAWTSSIHRWPLHQSALTSAQIRTTTCQSHGGRELRCGSVVCPPLVLVLFHHRTRTRNWTRCWKNRCGKTSATSTPCCCCSLTSFCGDTGPESWTLFWKRLKYTLMQFSLCWGNDCWWCLIS